MSRPFWVSAFMAVADRSARGPMRTPFGKTTSSSLPFNFSPVAPFPPAPDGPGVGCLVGLVASSPLPDVPLLLMRQETLYARPGA